MRIGLVGNGYWARTTHAAGLRRQPAVTLAGLWGRDPAKSQPYASEAGICAYSSYADLLADVDAVAFSVPPRVQAELALVAAAAGKHLLLEKPIATTVEASARLLAAVAEHDVASLVFFTSRFDAMRRRWLAAVTAGTGWDGASGLWLGSAFSPGSPFNTPWRHDKGGLWDVGPHALSLLAGALGDITEIVARPGPRDLVQLLTGHASGARSSYAVSIDTAAVNRNSLLVWGECGVLAAPEGGLDPVAALATAAGELAELAGRDDKSHPCDIRFGHRVVELLAQAEGQLAG